jgi:hypothetical protein
LPTLPLPLEELSKPSPISRRVPTLDRKQLLLLPILLWPLKQPEQMNSIQLQQPPLKLRRSSTEPKVNYNNSRRTLIEQASKLKEKFSLMKFSKDSMKRRLKKPISLMLFNT